MSCKRADEAYYVKTKVAKVMIVALPESKHILVVKTRKRFVKIPKAFSVTLRTLDKR